MYEFWFVVVFGVIVCIYLSCLKIVIIVDIGNFVIFVLIGQLDFKIMGDVCVKVYVVVVQNYGVIGQVKCFKYGFGVVGYVCMFGYVVFGIGD